MTRLLSFGIDISKQTVDVGCWPGGICAQFCRDTNGLAHLIDWIRQQGQVDVVVLEASGGYEKPVVAALQEAGLAVAMIQPQQGWFYARAINQHAKTDKLDALLLAQYGAAIKPHCALPLSPHAQRLRDVHRERTYVARCLASEKTRLKQEEAMGHQQTLSYTKERLALLKAQLAALDKALQDIINADDMLRDLAQHFQEIPGVGMGTAATLLAECPELGRLSHKKIACLAGVAPFTRESGQWKGRAAIRGGRKEMRCMLYMAAFNAIKHEGALRDFYQKLRKAGKPYKVAIVAVMRKLLTQLNAIATRKLKTGTA